MALKLKKFDPSEWLEDDEMIAEYLKESFESDEPREIIDALNDAIKARNITELATKIGVSRKELYKILSENENIDFTTIQKLLDVLGVKITVKQKKQIEQNISAFK